MHALAGLQTEPQSLWQIRISCDPNNHHITALHRDPRVVKQTVAEIAGISVFLIFIFIHRQKRNNQRQQKKNVKEGFVYSGTSQEKPERKILPRHPSRQPTSVQKAEGTGPLCGSLSKYMVPVDKVPMRPQSELCSNWASPHRPQQKRKEYR